MSTPRPSEADVEALAFVLSGASPEFAANAIKQHMGQARRLLASDWLAARDAEHEREVAALRAIGDQIADVAERNETRAEAAERALADLRGEIKALADEWTGVRDYRTYYGDRARDLRALLPRDDAAGGAE